MAEINSSYSLSLFYFDKWKPTTNTEIAGIYLFIFSILQLEYKFIRNKINKEIKYTYKKEENLPCSLNLVSSHPNQNIWTINVVTQDFLYTWRKIFQNDWKGK